MLGGTVVVGRALVEERVHRRWDVATFNRGLTGSDVLGASTLRGDRYDESSLRTLQLTGPWDAVVDCSGCVPRNVLAVAGALSSQKAGCEAAVRRSMGSQRTTILRPGVVLGLREYVGRLIWWLRRVSEGGVVVGPGSPARTIQPIDVRDLAAFAASCLENRTPGSFNVTAPIGGATFGHLLEACVQVTQSDAQLAWIPDAALLEFGVRQWSEMPLWRTSPGVWQVAADLATKSGLRTRPLIQTVTDTWRWMQTGEEVDGRDRTAEVGISREREKALLAFATGGAC